MEQSSTQQIVKESLDILKEKLVIALTSNDAAAIDKEINNLSASLSKMIAGLEELAFDAGRLQEDDGEFVFDDFEDFQNS